MRSFRILIAACAMYYVLSFHSLALSGEDESIILDVTANEEGELLILRALGFTSKKYNNSLILKEISIEKHSFSNLSPTSSKRQKQFHDLSGPLRSSFDQLNSHTPLRLSSNANNKDVYVASYNAERSLFNLVHLADPLVSVGHWQVEFDPRTYFAHSDVRMDNFSFTYIASKQQFVALGQFTAYGQTFVAPVFFKLNRMSYTGAPYALPKSQTIIRLNPPKVDQNRIHYSFNTGNTQTLAGESRRTLFSFYSNLSGDRLPDSTPNLTETNLENSPLLGDAQPIEDGSFIYPTLSRDMKFLRFSSNHSLFTGWGSKFSIGLKINWTEQAGILQTRLLRFKNALLLAVWERDELYILRYMFNMTDETIDSMDQKLLLPIHGRCSKEDVELIFR